MSRAPLATGFETVARLAAGASIVLGMTAHIWGREWAWVPMIGGAVVLVTYRAPVRAPLILVLAGALMSGIGLIVLAARGMASWDAAGTIVLGVSVTCRGWAHHEASDLHIRHLRNELLAYSCFGSLLMVLVTTALAALLRASMPWLIASVAAMALLGALGMYLMVRPLTDQMLVRVSTMEGRIAEATQALRRSNRDLEEFAYAASHDLQEPLRMVSSYVRLLEKRCKDQLDPTALEFIGFAVDGAERMQALVNDLLTYCRVSTRTQPFEPTDLNQVVKVALTNLESRVRETGAQIDVAPLPTVQADGSQMTRLFQNLIGNSLKFCDKSPPCVEITATQGDHQGNWTIHVRDNGIGIDPRHGETVFAVFQRLHSHEEYEGTGIGLAVCKRIVERHGGRIWFDSSPGEGAIFHFTVASPSTLASPPPEAAPSVDGRSTGP